MSEDGRKATGRAGIADGRSWAALALLGVIAGATTYCWHPAGWFWGAVLAFALLRSGAFVLSARALGRDPEEELEHERDDAPPAQPSP